MVSMFSAGEAANGAGLLSGRDLVLCDSLNQIGVPPHVSRILLCLSKGGWMDSLTMQNCCELRQPEVSVAVRSMVKMEIVRKKPEKTGGRGRPRNMYRLVGGLVDAIHPFILQAKAELNNLEGSLTRIEAATTSLRARS